MKLLLPLPAIERTLGPGWLQPVAVMPLANSSVVGQIIHSSLMTGDVTQVILPSRAGEGEVAEWFAANQPTVPAQFIALKQVQDNWHALWLSRHQWQDGPVLLLLGDAVVDAELGHLASEAADIICVIDHEKNTSARPPLDIADDKVAGLLPGPAEPGQWQPSGVFWFRNGRLLADVMEKLQARGGDEDDRDLARALLVQLLAAGEVIGTREARLRLPLLTAGTGLSSPELLLSANARLLSFGRSSAEAIERSYSEEFTVIPPVFIHETAIVESSVIDLQTCIAAGAAVRFSVVRHSIIGPGAVVENAVLDGVLLGQLSHISGTPLSSPVPDHQTATAEPLQAE